MLCSFTHSLQAMLRGVLWCYKGVTKVLQRCYKGVTKVLQRCYKGVTIVSLTPRSGSPTPSAAR
jgi:hypothetical protein